MERANPDGVPVLIRSGSVVLNARLFTPTSDARRAVLIASPGGTFHHVGYRRIAVHFASERFTVLMADLLTPDEEQIDSRTGHFRSDLTLLARRIRDVARWFYKQEASAGTVLFFGSGAAAAAAVRATASDEDLFAALALAAPPLDTSNEALRLNAPVLLMIPESNPSLLAAARRSALALGLENRILILHDVTSMPDGDADVAAIAEHAIAWGHRYATASRITSAL